MDDKQLNFFQPLLSVRRFPSTLSSQKDEKRKTDLTQSRTPHLPSYKSELKSGPIRHAGTVPFVWERSPGRPKNENIPQKNIGQPLVAPKLPPGRILQTTKEDSNKNHEHLSHSKRHRKVLNGSLSVSTPYYNVIEQESSENAMEAKCSDSGEGDEAYIDALDSLSRTESSFINCSASGLDGSGVNTSRTFSTDPQTRHFMMGRFLPAAKAMASETPQYAPKKQPLIREQPRPEIKIRSGDEKPPLRYGLNVTPHYAKEKDEESYNGYDRHGQFPANVCGLLPKFCLKSSLCLLNPMPGMSVKSRVPISPGSRTHGSSSSTGSSCENENEAQVDQLSCPFNPQKLEGSSLYRRLQGKGMSYPNNINKLPRSSFSEQKEFLPIHLQAKDAGATPLDPSSHRELDQGSTMIEKTLYVDIVHKMESPSVYFCSSNKSGESDSTFKVRENQNVEAEKTNLKVFCPTLVELSVPTVADKSNQVKNLIDFMDDFTNPKVHEFPQNGNNISGTQQLSEADIEKSDQSQEFPVPPPLPKSPSDSWLRRTLPSKSSKTPSSQSRLGMVTHRGDQASKISSVHEK